LQDSTMFANLGLGSVVYEDQSHSYAHVFSTRLYVYIYINVTKCMHVCKHLAKCTYVCNHLTKSTHVCKCVWYRSIRIREILTSILVGTCVHVFYRSTYLPRGTPPPFPSSKNEHTGASTFNGGLLALPSLTSVPFSVPMSMGTLSIVAPIAMSIALVSVSTHTHTHEDTYIHRYANVNTFDFMQCLADCAYVCECMHVQILICDLFFFFVWLVFRLTPFLVTFFSDWIRSSPEKKNWKTHFRWGVDAYLHSRTRVRVHTYTLTNTYIHMYLYICTPRRQIHNLHIHIKMQIHLQINMHICIHI